MIPWEDIKTEYLTTNTSYRRLADKYGVHFTQIAKKAKHECWQQEKQQLANKVLTDVATAVSDEKVDWLLMASNAYKNAIEKADYEIANNPKCVGTVLMNTVTAINNSVNHLRDIYNIPTPDQAEARRIAAEKLNLDKLKVNSNEDKAITVVIAKEAEEWSD